MKQTARNFLNAALIGATLTAAAEDQTGSKLLPGSQPEKQIPATNLSVAAPPAPSASATTNPAANWIQVTPKDLLDNPATKLAEASTGATNAPVFVADMELNDFLLALADQSGLSFVSCPVLKGLKVSGTFNKETPIQMAREAVRPYGVNVAVVDGSLVLSGEKIDHASPRTTYFHKFKNLKFSLDSGLTKPSDIEAFFTQSLGLSDGEVCKYSAAANMLLVHTTEDRKARLVDILSKLDVSKPLLRISMTIVEVENDPSVLSGVDWSGVLGASGVGLTVDVANSIASALTGGMMPYVGSTDSARYSVVARPSEVSLFLRFLESKNIARSIAKIEIVQKEGEKNSFKAVREQPMPNFQANAVTGGFDIQGFSFKDIGNVLKAQAYILPGENGKGDTAEVLVDASVSTLIGTQVFSSSGGSGGGLSAPIPIVDNTEMSSYLYIPIGKSMIVGGLKKKDENEIGNRVPLIGRVLPFLFSNDNNTAAKRDLAMILTVDVVNQSDMATSEEQLQQKVGLKSVVGGKFSAPKPFTSN